MSSPLRRAVVLVGGVGTRLRPLTLTTPKQMLPVAGLPMIERVLGHLAGYGIEEAVLALAYRPAAFTDAYPGGICAGVRIGYSVEDEPLDTAGAVAYAADRAGIDETFVVVNGDVITDLNLAELTSLHRARPAEATIALTPVEDPSAFGVVVTDDEGCVSAFIEKPPRDTAPSNTVSAGTYVLEPSVLGRIARGRRVSIERETFPALVADRALYAMVYHGDWLDLGTPAKYLQANLAWAAGSGGADGGAHVEPTAQIHPTASVTTSVLGHDVVVGPGATVHRSVVLAGSHIGHGATVTNSIIGRRVKVGRGASVTDLTVIGDELSVESAEVLVGVRRPEAGE